MKKTLTLSLRFEITTDNPEFVQRFFTLVGRNLARVMRRLAFVTKVCRVRVYTKDCYDPTYGDDRLCKCGHPYYRHFDTWDRMSPIGCKYCECINFEEAT